MNETKNPLQGVGGKGKHTSLMVALQRAGIRTPEQRHELVFVWTEGRTTSSKEMFDHEIDFVINSLNHNLTDASREMAALELVKRDKRAVVLAIAGRVGFFPDGSSNFNYFNSWMQKNSLLKKDLYKYTIDELDALQKQFRGIEANFNKSAEVPGTKAWHIKNKIPFESKN